MFRSFLCRLGWHHWEFRTTRSGDVVTTTGRCRSRCDWAGLWRIIDQRPARFVDYS